MIKVLFLPEVVDQFLELAQVYTKRTEKSYILSDILEIITS